MKYKILSDKVYIRNLLKDSFIENYREFLHDKVTDCFNSVVDRSQYVSVVFSDNDELVTFAFHRFIYYNGSTIDYLSGVSEIFLQSIKNKVNLFSVEFMTVDAKFRGKFTKYQPVDIMVGLVLRLMQNSADAVIGFSRQDNQTDKLSFRMGTRSVGTVDRFSLPCSVIFCESHNVKPHPIGKVENKINELWSNRFCEEPVIQRKAAA